MGEAIECSIPQEVYAAVKGAEETWEKRRQSPDTAGGGDHRSRADLCFEVLIQSIGRAIDCGSLILCKPPSGKLYYGSNLADPVEHLQWVRRADPPTIGAAASVKFKHQRVKVTFTPNELGYLYSDMLRNLKSADDDAWAFHGPAL